MVSAGINDQVTELNINTAHLEDVLRVLGEPQRYGWGQEVFDPNNLPDYYIMFYRDDIHVYMHMGWIMELRFASPASGYLWRGGLRWGSSLEEVLSVTGEPHAIVTGQASTWEHYTLALHKNLWIMHWLELPPVDSASVV